MFTKEVATHGRRTVPPTATREKQGGERCSGVVRMPLPAPVPIEDRARQQLLENCPYAFYLHCLSLQFENGVLTVRGRVPTFYLKQIIQSRLQNLDGVNQIDNLVDVVSATGLSSEPRIDSSE